MGVLINSAAFKYREHDTDPWQTLGIMADVDLESMADKFDTTSTYTEGELVMHGGYLYKCNAGGAGPGAWDVTEWAQTSVETELDHLQDLVTGDVMANFAANYNARTAYTIGKYCIHDGKLYRCIVAIPSPGEAWTAGHWASTNISNQVYNTIIKLSNQYNPARTYKKDEVCIYGDALKYCKIDMTQPEAWDFSHWGTVTGVMDVVGSGQLDSGFAADNLTGAANELRNTLTQLDSAKAAKVDLTNISQTSPNCTVTNGITKGTYFYLDGVLTRAIEAISENAPFTSSNCETVTAGGLNDLKNSLFKKRDLTVNVDSTKLTSGAVFAYVTGGTVTIILYDIKISASGVAVASIPELSGKIKSYMFAPVFGNNSANLYGSMKLSGTDLVVYSTQPTSTHQGLMTFGLYES